MRIRKARKSDYKGLQSLIEELSQYRESSFNPTNYVFHARTAPYESLMEEDVEDELFYIASKDEDYTVGFIQGTIHERRDHQLHKLGNIEELYVKDEMRGTGVADELLYALEEEFRSQGCDHMIVHTDYENEHSQQFFMKSGMNKMTVELWKKL